MAKEEIRAVIEVLSECERTANGDEMSLDQDDGGCQEIGDIRCDGNSYDGKYECRICRKVFEKRIDMHIHRIMHTSKSEEPSQSYLTNGRYSVRDEANIVDREKTSLNNEWRGIEEERYLCPTSSGLPSLLQSERLKTVKIQSRDLPSNWRIYKCSSCFETFDDIASYKNHILTHPDKLHRCRTCGKVFTIKGNLQRHEQSHQDIRPFKCSVCEKTFSQKSHLEAHMSVHDKYRTYYICSICGHSFTRQGNLKRHERIHTKEKPYQCHICSRSFSQPGNLKAHVLIHTEERPFQCSECGKSFTRKGNLTRHLDLHRERRNLREIPPTQSV